jgi:serine/threonine protein kinase
MDLAPGSRLGPYEILASIGKGGMGEVFKARDSRLGRDVAIKVSAQQFSERFEREARVIASLNHANICTLYDVGPNYLVMEFVEGGTLSAQIKTGAIPLDESLRIATQIADALAAAHARGVTHRDLKPGNIMIKPEGTVKVLDFGLAKISPTATSDAPTIPPL